jgi:hypothetical protein
MDPSTIHRARRGARCASAAPRSLQSPSQGTIEFGWRGPLRRNGQEVSLRGFPRYEAPWVEAPFPSDAIQVRAGGEQLALDWRSQRREASRFAD